MKIYTKTGDKGETGLFRGPRVPKDDVRVRVYGDVDELNALLGLSLIYIQDPDVHQVVSSLQHQLFEVGADLATPPQNQNDSQFRISEVMTTRLETEIDRFEERLTPLQQFILPGGSKGGAFLHYTRTVCRRAERSAVQLSKEQTANPEVLRYLNRLSDLLFVLARYENKKSDAFEVIWKKRSL